MTARTTRKSRSVTIQAAELALAVPQVVAHRVARMAIAGPTPSARARQEFERMVAEKKTAFAQAWQAMAVQAVRANQALALSLMRSFWSPSLTARPTPGKVAAQVQSAALGVFGKGLAPIHQKAVANAKRLARTRLR